MRYARVMGIAAAFLLALAIAGCGGSSGSSGGGSITPPPGTVSVKISPASSTVGYGGTQQFTATVTGSTNTAVTWSVTSAGGSGQIGTISTSGIYTAPTATSASPESGAPQTVSVTAGQTTPNTNISVPPLNATTSVAVKATSQADTSASASATVTLSGLSILAVGQCTPDTTKPGTLNCTAGSTGTEVSRSQSGGQTLYLFVAGFGILPGTTYSISGSDIVITQPANGQFQAASDGTPAVYFQIVVSPTAALGPRNLVVRNSGNELTSFVGGVSIAP